METETGMNKQLEKFSAIVPESVIKLSDESYWVGLRTKSGSVEGKLYLPTQPNGTVLLFEPGAGFGGGGFGQGQGQGGFRTYTWTGDMGDLGFDMGGGGGFADPFDIFEMVFGQRSPFGRQARLPRYVINITFDEAVHGTQKDVEIEGKRQKIKIPAGVDDGSEIRFSNYIIVCQVSRHSKFVRRGLDIVTEHEISYSKAALGSVEDIETVDGPVKIRIPAGTQPGTQIRLRGKGVPRVSGHGQGDHYVIIRVKVPSKLSRDEKRLLEELEKIS